MDVATLGQLGPFIGGVSIFLAACAAWLTLWLVQKRTSHLSWLDSFHDLHKEFWDENNVTVRSWIISERSYIATFQPVLSDRLKSKENSLSTQANKILDDLDRFCSLLLRMELLNEIGMNSAQRKLWESIHGEYWINQINERQQLREYISKYWPQIHIDKKLTQPDELRKAG